MTNEEVIIEKLGNIATALELDDKNRKSKLNASNIKSWLGVILSSITLLILLSSPYYVSLDRISKLEQFQHTIKCLLWDKVPGAENYIDNPYKTRGASSNSDMDVEKFLVEKGSNSKCVDQ